MKIVRIALFFFLCTHVFFYSAHPLRLIIAPLFDTKNFFTCVSDIQTKSLMSRRRRLLLRNNNAKDPLEQYVEIVELDSAATFSAFIQCAYQKKVLFEDSQDPETAPFESYPIRDTKVAS